MYVAAWIVIVVMCYYFCFDHYDNVIVVCNGLLLCYHRCALFSVENGRKLDTDVTSEHCALFCFFFFLLF